MCTVDRYDGVGRLPLVAFLLQCRVDTRGHLGRHCRLGQVRHFTARRTEGFECLTALRTGRHVRAYVRGNVDICVKVGEMVEIGVRPCTENLVAHGCTSSTSPPVAVAVVSRTVSVFVWFRSGPQ